MNNELKVKELEVENLVLIQEIGNLKDQLSILAESKAKISQESSSELPVGDARLDTYERESLNHLVSAWIAFMRGDHSSDAVNDFRQAIHICERILITRAFKRGSSLYWNLP